VLTHLEAEHFRNLEPLSWDPGPGRHLLLGGNGAGKTSLLEAVYVVATTKSFRTARLAECVEHRADAFRLAAEVETVARASLAVSWSAGGLQRTTNGSRAPLAEHLGVLPVVAWTARETESLTGAPAERRRLMDRGVVSARPGSLDALRRYREGLGHKRELLARAVSRGGPSPSSADLETWNRVLASAAAQVAGLRAAYVAALSRELEQVLSEIVLPLPRIDLRYRPSPDCATAGEAAIFERLEQAADSERRRGAPLLGPHRDDLEILWGGKPVAEVASAGETKALSVALLTAHGRTVEDAGKTPIYLLDDLDAELAPETLAAVWSIYDTTRQTVASSNRPAVWEGLEVDLRWGLRNGRIERL